MTASVVAEAPCGRVRGNRIGGITCFLGIPYAAPPVGRLRFAAPRAPAPFRGTFDADAYGPAAPQRRALAEPFATFAGLKRTFSEDCLNLHIWTPDTRGSRPVLVFIHGGGFIIGSGSQYPGADLARRGDAVVVTLNYRLGVFGFNGFAELFPGDARFAANAGLLDQRLALAWVRDNIAAFGGDPERVTIAGESAGAASVAFHMAAPGSHGLFSRAIMQSGGLNLFYPRAQAMEIGERTLAVLGAEADRERLFRLAPRAFGLAARKVTAEFPGIPSRPHFDCGELPDGPLPALYGAMKPVPLLIGTNRDEFSFFSELPIFKIDSDKPSLTRWVAETAGEAAAERIAALYPAGRAGRIAFGTDLLFRMAAIHMADSQSQRAPTYMYRLDWEAKGLLSRLGATHSVDLPLLFEDFLKPFRSVYLGVLPDPARQQLAIRMRERWMAFVNGGPPGDDWPAYRSETRETLVLSARRDRVEADPDPLRRVAWEGVDGATP